MTSHAEKQIYLYRHYESPSALPVITNHCLLAKLAPTTKIGLLFARFMMSSHTHTQIYIYKTERLDAADVLQIKQTQTKESKRFGSEPTQTVRVDLHIM